MNKKSILIIAGLLLIATNSFAQTDLTQAGVKNPFLPPEAFLKKTPKDTLISGREGQREDQQGISMKAAENIVAPDISISGIIWDTESPQAIINNQIVGIGDKINQFEVTHIERSRIDLTFSGVTFIYNIDEMNLDILNKEKQPNNEPSEFKDPTDPNFKVLTLGG